MKSLDKTNTSSKLSYQKNGTPYCQRFDDIYFDSKSGTLQSNFVFIQKNQIKNRLKTAKKTFTIAETGFGTGLNFLLTLQAYQEVQQNSDRAIAPLHFISVDKSPLSKTQLQQSLSILPQLETLSRSLVASYPEGEPEKFTQAFTASFLNDQVRLTLIFDDAIQGLSSLKS